MGRFFGVGMFYRLFFAEVRIYRGILGWHGLSSVLGVES